MINDEPNRKYTAIFFGMINNQLNTFSQSVYANTKTEANRIAKLEAKQKDLRLVEVRS